PDLPYSTAIAEEAAARGIQVILHLPLEPDDATIRLGEGGIRVAMSDEEIRRTVAADLATVPSAVGANNHMGSLGTSDPRVMRAVMGEMRTRHLFFVDSVTSPHSVAAQVARAMSVPTASRAVRLCPACATRRRARRPCRGGWGRGSRGRRTAGGDRQGGGLLGKTQSHRAAPVPGRTGAADPAGGRWTGSHPRAPPPLRRN